MEIEVFYRLKKEKSNKIMVEDLKVQHQEHYLYNKTSVSVQEL